MVFVFSASQFHGPATHIPKGQHESKVLIVQYSSMGPIRMCVCVCVRSHVA